MIHSSAMAPIDPHQLLEALKPLLSLSGGIKGATEAARISSLMKDANKLVARCIYCNILKCTQDQDAIKKFVESGGWDVLNTWLQDSKELENHPVMLEILKVYQAFPVTVRMLKQNNAAKTIKQLGKIGDEKVKMLSSTIVESWKKKVREKTGSENDADKSKKKKENKNNKHKDKDNKDKKEKPHHHAHHHGDSVKESDSRLTDSTSADSTAKSDKAVINDRTNHSKNTDSSDSSSKKRTSTVKSFSGKFRSTGLEDQTLPAVKKKSQDNIPKALPPKRMLPDLRLDEHVEKKPRLTLTMPPPTLPGAPSSISPPEVTHGKIKLIPPKRQPAHEIQESSGFMDSLTKPVSFGSMKRKKKASPGKPGTPPTPSTPLSPTTAMAHKLPSVPSFYQDTLETSEEKPEEKAEVESTSPTEDMDTSENGSTTSTVTKGSDEQEQEMDKENKDTTEDKDNTEPAVKTEEENNSESVSSSEPKGVLTTGATKRKKPKKTVSWAADAQLKQTFYFELDETERENVNRPKNFNEMKKQEAHLDKKAMETAKRLINDNMVEMMQWRRPPPLDVVGGLVDRGANSIEKDIQKAREQKVLQAIFFTKTMLPDAPAEPEPEPIEPSQPKIIPLEDESNSGEEFVHTYDNVKSAPVMLHPLPPPVNLQNVPIDPMSLPYDPEFNPHAPIANANGSFELPPEVAGVLASFQIAQAPGESPQSLANNTLANVQHILHTLMAGQDSKATELMDKLRHALEPFKNQLPEYLHGYFQPGGPQHAGMVPLGGMPSRPGLLGNAPPGFHPMMPGPPQGLQGPPGPRPCFPLQGPNQFGPGDDQWGENIMGGPQGPMRMPGPGFPMRGPSGPPMGGPRGPPPRMMRGRGDSRGGRGRGIPPVCRHFMAKKKCRFGNSCGYLHPQPDGPPP
ncbi:serine/threonine-protein phosphatase 1 regulatory subunit 10-like [Gigantopelta aegis]|uniref:serine/threonine-protein phosphatase 1 regulatory subunit 10-like n=1 Tax=Gigantopelta aegis TaxID=1735272 RepID=UPI001B88B26B|nr:serine/threonine-protein phosphatase 1 regulatory subunit 10-like [Gigantopelta aegis]XP_041371060.1 serine/threonine-protein phosphatase 1 regulatory subunit 10-like [Gigantopelta aegis]XP_041371061.1 serine/threonine-protein phosphatase 1 regulatory subunit 10-like [Gigantopelta aegis]